MRGAAVLAVLVLLSGCLSKEGATTTDGCDAPSLPVSLAMFGERSQVGAQPFDALFATWDAASMPTIQGNSTTNGGAPIDVRVLGTSNSSALYSFTYAPLQAGDNMLDAQWEVATAGGSCTTPLSYHALLPQEAGPTVEVGKGTHVWYAGFFTNGTLFDTNIASIDQSSVPRVGWYQSEPYEPLPVYVYDQDRSEEPAYWKDPTSAAPPLVPVGAGLGYYTTIKGFNDALKGLSTAGSRVVSILPEDAYPDPIQGAPGLGGSTLVFLVQPADVMDAPCPAAAISACQRLPLP